VYEAERRAHPRTPAEFALLKADLAAWHDQARPVSAVTQGFFFVADFIWASSKTKSESAATSMHVIGMHT